MLESLVTDNEALRRDNQELQKMLLENREELRGLQEEAEERTASFSFARHRYSESNHSLTFSDSSGVMLSPTFSIGTAPSHSVLHSAFRPTRTLATQGRRASSMERGAHKPFVSTLFR